MTKTPTRRAQFETVVGDLEAALKKLKALAETAASDPYLADAQSFLTQATVCVQKQIVTEFGSKNPIPEGAAVQ
jgi:hypothetical protein